MLLLWIGDCDTGQYKENYECKPCSPHYHQMQSGHLRIVVILTVTTDFRRMERYVK